MDLALRLKIQEKLLPRISVVNYFMGLLSGHTVMISSFFMGSND